MNVGDIVRLRHGAAPIVVRSISPSHFDGMYIYSEITVHRSQRDAEPFLHFDNSDGSPAPQELLREGTKPSFILDSIRQFLGEEQQQEGNEDMTTLYQTNENPPRFGTLLTKNSEGHFVLEMKGEGGKVEVYSRDNLTEVLPYTASFEPLGTGAIFHAVIEKGSLKTGDFIVKDNRLFRVFKLNTKKRCASALGKAYRIPVEVIGETAEESTDSEE
jgi:hypothetical protein